MTSELFEYWNKCGDTFFCCECICYWCLHHFSPIFIVFIELQFNKGNKFWLLSSRKLIVYLYSLNLETYIAMKFHWIVLYNVSGINLLQALHNDEFLNQFFFKFHWLIKISTPIGKIRFVTLGVFNVYRGLMN